MHRGLSGTLRPTAGLQINGRGAYKFLNAAGRANTCLCLYFSRNHHQRCGVSLRARSRMACLTREPLRPHDVPPRMMLEDGEGAVPAGVAWSNAMDDRSQPGRRGWFIGHFVARRRSGGHRLGRSQWGADAAREVKAIEGEPDRSHHVAAVEWPLPPGFSKPSRKRDTGSTGRLRGLVARGLASLAYAKRQRNRYGALALTTTSRSLLESSCDAVLRTQPTAVPDRRARPWRVRAGHRARRSQRDRCPEHLPRGETW